MVMLYGISGYRHGVLGVASSLYIRPRWLGHSLAGEGHLQGSLFDGASIVEYEWT